MTTYTLNITEQESNNLISSIPHFNTVPLMVNERNGLVRDQVYRLVIEAENSVGSTISEEILFCK